ncbi:hypothetical protein Tco_0041119 [Tanacetum coccineum]
MITNNNIIEGKKPLGLMLSPQLKMVGILEAFPCVRNALCITQDLALSSVRHATRYGYCKNLKKTVKTGQTRTRERKSTQRAGRMLSKVNNGQLKSTFSQTWSTLNDKNPKNTKPVPQS